MAAIPIQQADSISRSIDAAMRVANSKDSVAAVRFLFAAQRGVNPHASAEDRGCAHLFATLVMWYEFLNSDLVVGLNDFQQLVAAGLPEEVIASLLGDVHG